MARFSLLVLLTYTTASSFGYSSLMYISAKPVSCASYTYEIEIIKFSDLGSDVIFGGLEIVYGDGSVDDFPDSDFETSQEYNGREVTKYVRKHSFHGPGIYSLNARFFNRTPSINNMQNSVNTPFYVKTVIHVDPYLGCNHTPVFENYPLTNKSGFAYFHDFSFNDPDNDSLSFHLTTPLQDTEIPVVNYWLPAEWDDSLLRKTSKISLDPFNGSLLLNSMYMGGGYTVALIVTEWRKIEEVYYQISSSTLDYLIDLEETNNHPAEISGLQDTAIIVGNNFTKNISISDPDGDSLQENAYGDFFQLMNKQQNENYDFFKGPITETINFTPIPENVRSKPYKGVFSAVDKNIDSGYLKNSESMYVWIAQRQHEPEPPQNFKGQAISKNQINLYWNDSKDELGYIVERADLYFPKFERFVVLPANTTFFNDLSVTEKNTYQYRITAVGTKMSAKKTIEVSTPDIITGIDKNTYKNELKFFPNPNSGTFYLTNFRSSSQLIIRDLFGKIVFEKPINLLGTTVSRVEIATLLTKGIYIINVNEHSEKMIIN